MVNNKKKLFLLTLCLVLLVFSLWMYITIVDKNTIADNAVMDKKSFNDEMRKALFARILARV